MDRKILLIYTGGTIGMQQDPETGLLRPFDFQQITHEVPELKKFGYAIETVSFDPLIDSSDVNPAFWVKLAGIIQAKYAYYDGFVVLHGTDTMAYSASAMSFMLENVEKPVIFTGSQLPIGMLRTDGKENLISSIQLAADQDEAGFPRISEVCIYFDSQLFRGNRTTKYSAENFRAFRSANYPVLADVGIHVKYNEGAIYHPRTWGRPLRLHTDLDTRVTVLKIFPGITEPLVRSVLSTPGLRAVVLETYGSGNSLSDAWFLDALRSFTSSGGVMVNVTQCQAGAVDMGAYANGDILRQAGLVSGGDMTTEAALTKLFVLLGQYADNKIVREKVEIGVSGEISEK